MGHRTGSPRAIVYSFQRNGVTYWTWMCPHCGKHSDMSRLNRNQIKPPHKYCTGRK
jgi:hypothetical protein